MTEFEKNPHQRFHKSERLSSRKQIQYLFEKGKSKTFICFMVKYMRLPDDEQETHQVLITVSKRNFKKAVDRNKIKRQLREAYRLNKQQINDLPNKYAIAYIYTLKKMIPFKDLEKELINSLSRLSSELAGDNEK